MSCHPEKIRRHDDESLFAPPNWVRDRADCNLAVTFNALFSVAERDVAEANRIEALTSPSTAFRYPEPRMDGIRANILCLPPSGRESCSGSAVPAVPYAEICIDPTMLGEAFRVRARWDSSKNSCELFVNDVP